MPRSESWPTALNTPFLPHLRGEHLAMVSEALMIRRREARQFASWSGNAIPVSPSRFVTGGRLAFLKIIDGLVRGQDVVTGSRVQLDVIRADAEDSTELAHLGDLRLSPSTLPQVDRLGPNSNRQRQIELRPATLGSERADGLCLHRPATPPTVAFTQTPVI